MAFFERTLIFLGGADPKSEAFENNSQLRIFYAAVGLAVLGAATFAGLSMSCAIYQITKDINYSIIGAIAWGLGIGMIEHLLVSTMSTGKKTRLLSTARILLAIIVGTLVSIPAELYIFNPEIQKEIKTTKLREINETDRFIQNAYAERFKNLESRIIEERNVINSAKKVCDNLNVEFLKEVDGSGGSLKRGYAAVATVKEKAKNDCSKDFSAKYPEDEIDKEPTTQLLKTTKEELKNLKEEAEKYRQETNNQTAITDGYFLRLSTYHILMSKSDWQIQGLMMLLPLVFCLFELMPVLAMLSNSNNDYIEEQKTQEKITARGRQSKLATASYYYAVIIQMWKNLVRSENFIKEMSAVEEKLGRSTKDSIEAELEKKFGVSAGMKKKTVASENQKDSTSPNKAKAFSGTVGSTNGNSNGFHKSSPRQDA